MMLDNASGWKPANPGLLRIGLRGGRLAGRIVEAWRKLLNYVAEFAAAGIYLWGFRRRRLDAEPTGASAREVVAAGSTSRTSSQARWKQAHPM